MLKKIFLIIILCQLMLVTKTNAQANAIKNAPTRQDTLKGSVTPGRSWWKVVRYNLLIEPDYNLKSITGRNSITYRNIKTRHSPLMQLDLQAPLHIDSILQHGKQLGFKQDGDAWFVRIPKSKLSVQDIIVYYSGKPKVSVNPPWDGGVVWTTDSLNRPWMAVACQLSGASTWYPCKTYIGDKPDHGASISIIVPDSLTAVSNGRLKAISKLSNHKTIYKWAVSSPINNYGLTFYIGKYVHVPDHYAGENDRLSMDFWVLDYNRRKVRSYLIPEVHQTVHTFEYWYGPYPFYRDGFKMVEAPYIGMEHQSAVGYGNHFMHGRYKAKRLTPWDMKTDRMVVHENAHEWFGNSITAKDPADGWIQEGFAGFAEELAIEDRYGKAAGEAFFIDRTAGRIGNEKPVIARYGIFEDGDDTYLKGWVLIHMIRAMMHDDRKFRDVLRGLSRTFYHQAVTTQQMEAYITLHSGIDLRKVFDQYLRTINIPVLEYSLNDKVLHYHLTNCVPGLALRLQTNWTKDKIITPNTDWQKAIVDTIAAGDTLKVKPDFYVQVKRISE